MISKGLRAAKAMKLKDQKLFQLKRKSLVELEYVSGVLKQNLIGATTALNATAAS